MTEILMLKTPSGGLAPADDEGREIFSRLSVGQPVKVKITRVRNIRFHRKMFALLKLGHDAWNPPVMEYKGCQVEKNFDRFRKDVLILAGYYTSSVNIKGEVRLDAKSLSFSSMDEAEFAKVYKSVLDVIWKRVLKAQYALPSDVDRIVEELLRFE